MNQALRLDPLSASLHVEAGGAWRQIFLTTRAGRPMVEKLSSFAARLRRFIRMASPVQFELAQTLYAVAIVNLSSDANQSGNSRQPKRRPARQLRLEDLRPREPSRGLSARTTSEWPSVSFPAIIRPRRLQPRRTCQSHPQPKSPAQIALSIHSNITMRIWIIGGVSLLAAGDRRMDLDGHRIGPQPGRR